MNHNDQRVLDGIRSFMAREGRSPTYYDIQTEMPGGEMAQSQISRSLTSLVEQGAIERPSPGKIVVPGLKMPKPKATSKRRNCLACGNKFDSTWDGHRVCNSCKGTKDWRASQAGNYSAPGLRI